MKVIDVACPRCKAKAGSACVQRDGKPVVGIPHMARRDAWWDVQRRPIDADPQPEDDRQQAERSRP